MQSRDERRNTEQQAESRLNLEEHRVPAAWRGGVRAGALLAPLSLFALLGCSSDPVPEAAPTASAPVDAAPAPRATTVRQAVSGEPLWSVQNAVVHLNGEPFFPLGIYWVGHSPAPEVKGKRLRDLELIAQAGFNMVHTPIDRQDGPFLDRCAALGIFVAVEFNEDPAEMIEQFKDHPAVAVWSTFDDVDAAAPTGGARHAPEKVLARHLEVKAADPSALTYISAGYPQRFTSYAGRSDLMAFQAYPIPAEPLGAVTDGYLGPAAKAVSPHNQGFVANLQAFGWHGVDRPPTGAELRNMTYQALIAGVRGIIYYTFFDEVTDLAQNPGLLSAAAQTAGEVRALERFWLRGQRVPLATARPEVFAAQWALDGEVLVAVANASGAAAELDLGLAHEAPAGTHAPFGGNAGAWSLRNHRLSGMIGPDEAAVLILK